MYSNIKKKISLKNYFSSNEVTFYWLHEVRVAKLSMIKLIVNLEVVIGMLSYNKNSVLTCLARNKKVKTARFKNTLLVYNSFAIKIHNCIVIAYLTIVFEKIRHTI